MLRVVGYTDNLEPAAHYLYREWLPASGEEARDFPIYCQRLSFFPEVPEHETVAELFLPLGAPLTLYEDRQGRALLYATGTAAPRQERLTLLINARTASSAELFAGVLRWPHRAELVGAPTTGKRTVQRVVRLDQAYLLFLTTGRFLAPDGSPFGVHGLIPDRAYEGDNVVSLMAPCADTTPPGP